MIGCICRFYRYFSSCTIKYFETLSLVRLRYMSASMATLALPMSVPARVFKQNSRPAFHSKAAGLYKRALRVSANLRVASDAPTHTAAAFRKFMMNTLGWDEAWADSISSDYRKRRIQASFENCEAVVRYLRDIGIPNASVCNMVTICKDLLRCDVSTQLQPVVEYIQSRGVKGPALVRILEGNPGLLTYTVCPYGTYLEKGRARASVELRNKAAGVSYWREGAAFESAPVAPFKPGAL